MPLRQLYPDPKADENYAPHPSVDIIAVHGLGPPAKGEAKHAFDTWRTPSGQKGRLWLQQDLPDHIPNSRIFLYQYNTTAAYGQGHDVFHSKADNLLEAINVERRDCPDRPILLLGHSIGGMLIKQALINAHSAAIAIELGHETGGDLVVSLRAGSAFSQIESWKHQALEYVTVSFWGSTDTMVSHNSVKHGLPGDIAKVVELDAYHRGICKFSNSYKDQYNFKVVVENIKHLYDLAIQKAESQYDGYQETSGVETPSTSGYGQDEHHDILEEIQRVALSTTNDTEQPVMTPSQGSQLQDYEAVAQDSVKAIFDHSTAKDVSNPPVSEMQDPEIAEIQGMLSEAHDKLYSTIPFELLSLPEPVLRGIQSLNYQKPTNVQEAVLSALMLLPPRNIIASYPPGTGRTIALAIALLSYTPFSSTTQPQVLAIVPTLLLARQTEKCIKEMGRFCEGLVIENITTTPRSSTAKVEANVIIATPIRLLVYIRRRLLDTSLVRLFLMDDADYLVDSQGLSEQCRRVAGSLPGPIQFILFSDLSTQASRFINQMLRSNAYEKHELKSSELHVYKTVHLFFRCDGDTGEQQKLDIICKLPGVVMISMLIIFVKGSRAAQHIHRVLVNQGYAVANLFDATDSFEMEEILDKFKARQAKVLITNDCKTRGLDLPASSMVINYDVPDADARRYLRQTSRAGKAGRFGFAVNLVSNDREKEYLQSVATGFNLRELKSDDWDAVENFLGECTKSQRL